MLRLLRDQIWQFIGAFIGLLALVAAIWIFYIERPVKQLQVVILSSAPLVNVDPEVADQIEVSYRGEPIENIAFVDIRLENNGNQPIIEADYSRPITFSFPDFWEVVSTDVLTSNPLNLGLTTIPTASANEAQIEPVLLNPGDSATVRFTVMGRNVGTTSPINVPESIPTIDARIAGVRQVRIDTLDEALTRPESRTSLDPLIRLFFLFSLSALVMLYIGRGQRRGLMVPTNSLFDIVISIIVIAIFVALIILRFLLPL